jgi:hypothetical protein
MAQPTHELAGNDPDIRNLFFAIFISHEFLYQQRHLKAGKGLWK